MHAAAARQLHSRSALLDAAMRASLGPIAAGAPSSSLCAALHAPPPHAHSTAVPAVQAAAAAAAHARGKARAPCASRAAPAANGARARRCAAALALPRASGVRTMRAHTPPRARCAAPGDPQAAAAGAAPPAARVLTGDQNWVDLWRCFRMGGKEDRDLALRKGFLGYNYTINPAQAGEGASTRGWLPEPKVRGRM